MKLKPPTGTDFHIEILKVSTGLLLTQDYLVFVFHLSVLPHPEKKIVN